MNAMSAISGINGQTVLLVIVAVLIVAGAYVRPAR